MAVKENKNTISYPELLKKLSKDEIPNNILLFTNEKTLLDEITSAIAKRFLGGIITKDNVRTFYSDDKNIEGVLNECSNYSFFSEKKIIILKVLKRAGTKGGFTNAERQSLIAYISNFNENIVFILNVLDKEFNFEHYKDFVSKKLSVFILDSGSINDIASWVKIRFDDYKISEETVLHFLQFLNPSYDEINSEIGKLKTYAMDKKEITKDDVNLCIGFSRDFDETDFLEAVLTGNYEMSIRIYDKLSLKEDVEVLLVSMLGLITISASKLMDPQTDKLGKWELIRELKLWGESDRKLRIVREFKSKLNELKLKQAFDYIYNADKAIKSSGLSKKGIITDLIYNMTKI
jgi:DNA polymerase-3 subunit delta